MAQKSNSYFILFSFNLDLQTDAEAKEVSEAKNPLTNEPENPGKCPGKADQNPDPTMPIKVRAKVVASFLKRVQPKHQILWQGKQQNFVLLYRQEPAIKLLITGIIQKRQFCVW